jgi:branched-chain amino acid transport system ATP-binding protein
MTALLQVDDVSHRFGGYLALNSATCEIAAGQVHALIGPNGAGKTTLFNIVSGLLRPTSGRTTFKGQDYTGHRPDKILAMGIARNFQQVRLVRGLSVVENVMIGAHARMNRGLLGNMAEFCGSAAAERQARDNARSMLDFVGVSGKAGLQPDDLTLVNQRRLEIARALASGPELLLLDEPAAGMNPTELGELGALIGRIQARGVTVLLVEHHMQLVMAIANCITVLSAGNVIADGPPHIIQRDPAVISAYLGSGDEPAVRS